MTKCWETVWQSWGYTVKDVDRFLKACLKIINLIYYDFITIGNDNSITTFFDNVIHIKKIAD